MSLCVIKTGWDAHMTDPVEGERISLRLDAEDLNLIDEFISKSNEFSNRSQLARAAVRAYIEMREGGSEGANRPSEIVVQLPPMVLETIKTLVAQGMYTSVSEAVADGVRHYFLHEEQVEEMKKEANQQQGSSFKVVPGA